MDLPLETNRHSMRDHAFHDAVAYNVGRNGRGPEGKGTYSRIVAARS
jgi:hypothetical protein